MNKFVLQEKYILCEKYILSEATITKEQLIEILNNDEILAQLKSQLETLQNNTAIGQNEQNIFNTISVAKNKIGEIIKNHDSFETLKTNIANYLALIDKNLLNNDIENQDYNKIIDFNKFKKIFFELQEFVNEHPNEPAIDTKLAKSREESIYDLTISKFNSFDTQVQELLKNGEINKLLAARVKERISDCIKKCDDVQKDTKNLQSIIKKSTNKIITNSALKIAEELQNLSGIKITNTNISDQLTSINNSFNIIITAYDQVESLVQSKKDLKTAAKQAYDATADNEWLNRLKVARGNDAELKQVWQEYFDKEFGGYAAKASIISRALTIEILEKGFSEKTNPFIAFLKRLFHLLPAETTISSDAYIAAIHNSYIKEYISDADLRGYGELEEDNIIFCADLYTKHPNDITQYVKQQSIILKQDALNLKNAYQKVHYENKGKKQFIIDLFYTNGSTLKLQKGTPGIKGKLKDLKAVLDEVKTNNIKVATTDLTAKAVTTGMFSRFNLEAIKEYAKYLSQFVPIGETAQYYKDFNLSNDDTIKVHNGTIITKELQNYDVIKNYKKLWVELKAAYDNLMSSNNSKKEA